MRVFLFLVIGVFFSGCARPGDHPINSNCLWIEDDNRPLNLEKSADRRHLRYDAATAEDVAIRWADQYYSHFPEYDQRCTECREKLFKGVAEHHGVDVALVRRYSSQRDLLLDSGVVLGFGILYAVVAYVFAGRIRRRFPPGEPGFLVMSLTMAIGISLVAVMIGMLGSIVIEEIRFGSGHLSYRMNRIPFRQHWVILYLGGFSIFVLTTVLRSRPGKHQQARS